MHSLWTLLLILDLVTVNSRFFNREEKLVEALHVERLLERHLQEERASVIGFADPEVCYPALSNADGDGDQLVTADEYVSFCQDMGPSDFLTDASSFEDLPLLLQSNFIALACLCQTDPDDDSCCVGENAAIRADGSYADEVPTPAEESYLFIVCSLTVSSVERVLASSPPSANPTSEPSSSPTSLPSRNPSVSPTDPATLDPTETPSEIPTQSPITLSPTVPPGVPTASPSSTPTSTPTTAIPTGIPTPAPTGQPTTATPTEAPIPNSIPVSVFYDIGVRPDAEQSRYIQELEDAMDVLAADVLESIPLGRRILQGRRLQSLRLPTDATVIQDIECPASSRISSEDICQAVFASIVLIFLPDFESQEEFSDRFSQALQGQIASGELTDVLNRLHPETQVYILDDDTLDRGGGDGGNGDSISGGGVAGIVVGALALVAAVGLFAARRGPTKDDEVESLDPVPLEKDMEPFDPMGTLGAVTADYGKGLDAMMDNDEALNNMSLDSSSNAGSSGWSSSAGVSSLNTGEDDSYNQISAFGSTLRALGMNTIDGQPVVSSRDVPKGPGVTRADLDSAIEQGDWAAVGATAALLAAASDSQSFSSHNMSATVSRSESSSLDAARAAELDQLVESGDWEGVVLAAAKYEAGTDSASGSGSGASQSSTTQESRSTRKMAEYRQEVVDLVRRVVPEESPNVDEMMQQFRGREEELVETLRTMEERAVAQKAKDATQHQAKIQAKQKTQEQRAADATALVSYMRSPDTDPSFQGASPSVVRSLGSGQVSATAQSLGTGEIEGGAKSKSLGTGEFADGRGKKHNALEEAIEAGDWEAVGEAAAMLSDHSLASSVETDEINRLADGLSSQGSASSKGNLSEQAEELEQLIERGDWTGVVDVAAGKSLGTSKQKALDEATRRQRRIKQRKHEDDALTGAHIWDAIAEQTKEVTGTDNSDQAARNAADWAIGRSLSALVQAEEGNRLTREDSALGDSRHDTLTEEEV